ncbi:MAG: hypothetical protein ACSLFN_16330 [Candidatus Limnocylindrales bacterium]
MGADLGEPVQRAEDGDLLGYVAPHPDGGTSWLARAVFGGTLGVRSTAAEARALVDSDGLAALAQRWFHRSAADGTWRVVVLTETRPGRARGVFGLYALPGAPTFEISAADLAAGDEMTLEPPDDADLDFALPG